jgi:hypothetical protein
MLRHLAFPLALRTLAVGWVQFLGSRALQFQLGYVDVDYQELLLVEQYTIGKTQLGDLALRPAGPGTEISYRDR